MSLKTDVRAIAKLCGVDESRALDEVAPKRPARPATRPLGLRWMTHHYAPLRNAAWLVRNSRTARGQNPVSLDLVTQECTALVASGEDLRDVIEALCELLRSP